MTMAKGQLEPSYRRRAAYQAMLLGGIATLAATSLVLGEVATRAEIAARRAEDLKASLGQVIPARLHDNDLLDDVITLGEGKAAVTAYRARAQAGITAVAYEVVGQGYAGPVTCILGVGSDGRVLGVRVIAHAETPGLGDKIELRKDDWVLAFDGKSLGEPSREQWAVKKDGGVFDQFSGATITPRAVVGAVKHGLDYFAAHRAELLDTTPQ
jgi:electron transport complex protein RnfG